MKQERITLREGCAALIGATLMLSAMILAQCLDGYDKAKEEEALRESAARVGFEEGLARLRCVGGIRYDLATGMAVDLQEEFLVRRTND